MEQLYISILAGDGPATTRPIMTSSDPRLIRAFGDALKRRLEEGLAGPDARMALRLLDNEAEGGADE